MVVRVVREERDADARAHVAVAAGDVHRQLQGFDDARGHRGGGVRVGDVAQDDGELIAAQARDRVAVLDA